MPVFSKGNTQVYYEVFSPSDAASGVIPERGVTLLNGYTRTSRDFRSMARFLSDAGWQCLILDNRGSGQTVGPADFTLAESASDVPALWEHLGWRSSHVLGISYGGILSQELALSYPDRLQSLCLVSTTSEAQFIEVEQSFEGLDREALERELARYFSNSFVEKNKLLVAAMAKEMSQTIQAFDKKEGAKAQRRALKSVDYLSRLAEVQCPVLWIHGEDDRVIPIEAARRAVSVFSNAELQIFPGVGHLLLAEAPKKLYQAYGDFLREFL